MAKKKVGAYPGGMILFSLTSALFLIGFCGMLVLQSKKLVRYIRENNEVRVFLDKDLDKKQLEKLHGQIVKKPFVLYNGTAPQVNFVSKETAAKEFMADTQENFTNFLNENPLRDSYRIKLQEDYFEEAKLQQVKADLEDVDGVFEVIYQENIVDEINKNITKIYIIMSVFAVIMLVIIIVLMNNTIRLALYSQRLLIRSMQLVGATNSFIQLPFLRRGMMQGLISGLVAAALLFILLQVALRNIDGLATLQEPEKIGILLGAVVVLGIIIGLISTFQAVHRYLRLSLDELY
ncbi:cell division transport system permease protein [Larkinella arboricola]|uniref:Cell division protein FtsX n=1 Tax=Larkinella arboricola TaxID=643671 RepID=A0A327WJZ6_LARAB|nr:permease-like cell division protein FtsX [Larkinella arboricola]RAJ92113.1 cell division transport system permease protein [Larkinella arboricola]